jgi:hypothetical protein
MGCLDFLRRVVKSVLPILDGMELSMQPPAARRIRMGYPIALEAGV